MKRLLWLVLASAFAACSDDAATCTASTPVCDPVCGVGATCTFANDACSCTPVVPTCNAAMPMCPGSGPNSGCAANERCKSDCSCEIVTPTCNAAMPVCPGTGPNSGCAADERCKSDCTCEAVTPTCNAAAPVCPGTGPNMGCAASEMCKADCSCEARPACQPDAPMCAGGGPNNGCAANEDCSASCACEPRVMPGPGLIRPSRSTAVDISRNDEIAAMVNTDDGSVSFFNVAFGAEARLSRVQAASSTTASEPSAVVIHPDGLRAFVANRATGTVSRIVGINTAGAMRDAELAVGVEPAGLALSPTGAHLWVTDWIGGTVTVVDTTTFTVERTIAVGGSPYAIAMTNDGDMDDADEKVYVTQFFARQRAAAAVKEGTDDGREGVVQVIPANGAMVTGTITLAPITECFSSMVGNPPMPLTSGCFPNQLYGITIHSAFGKTRAYVTSVGASPAGPQNFGHSVQALVSVIDLSNDTEDTARTINLNKLVAGQRDADGDDNMGRRFLNTPVGIDFANRDDAIIGYVASAASDIVLRVVWGETATVAVGAPQALNIPVGQNPQGIVVKHGSVNSGALTGNLISRDLSVISFRDQRQLKVVSSTEVPTDPMSDAFKVWRGKRFFNTSTGIWSKEGWGSCQGCHPFGLTDNVTWKFGAGPRQTIALDGQFASRDRRDMRALNWTAIFDETADFELNVRGTSGGSGTLKNMMGALVSPMGTPPLGGILMEDGVTRENHQALNGSTTFLAKNTQVCTNAMTCPDFILVDRYIQTIRSPRGIQGAQAAPIMRGRQVFSDAGCDKCHAGPKWTISRTFHTPERSTGALPMRVFDAARAFMTMMDTRVLRGLPMNVNRDMTLIAGDDSNGGMPPLKRSACNIRDVGTFEAMGGAAETRDNGTPAQGRNGFNPPSLLNVAAGAPYYHNGAAATLEEAFDRRFNAHLTAGAPNPPTASDVTDLVAFLRSIDETTAPFPLVAGSTLCPSQF